MSINHKKVIVSCIGICLSMGYMPWAAASVTVPSDVRALADSLKNEAFDNVTRAKAAAEARDSIARMEKQLTDLQDEKGTAADEKLLAQLEQTKKDLSAAIVLQAQQEMERTRLESQWQDVQRVLSEQKEKSDALASQLEAVPEGTEADAIYEEQVRLDPIIEELDEQDAAIYGQLQEMDTQLEQTMARIDQLDELNDQLGKKAETAVSRAERKSAADILKKDIQQEKQNLYEYENVTVKNRHSQIFATASKYYSWSDDKGHSGSQFYQEFSYGMVKNAWEYSIDGGYIFSNNKAASNGSLNTLTDTSISATYTQPLKHGDAMLYTLGLNLPTGKDALHGNDPVMSDDLVEKERFGEGFNITPEIWWHHKVNERNTLILGTYYNFAGSYDLDSTMANSWLNPGNSWVKVLQWKYISPRVQALLELTHTSYEDSEQLNQRYRSGNNLGTNITLNYFPEKKQFFTFYWWNSNEQPVHMLPGTEETTSETRIGNHIGLQWAKEVGARGRLRIGFDYLRYHGAYFNPVTNLTTNQRKKTTWGIGYDFFLGKEKNKIISLDLERFNMEDYGEGSTGSRYQGCDVYVHFLKTF